MMNEKEKRQNLITNVYLMIRKVKAMNNNKERTKLLYEIDALLSFMYYAEYIKLNEYQDIWNKIGNREDTRYKRRNMVFKELYLHNDELCNIYENNLKKYNITNMKYNNTKVNPSLLNTMVLNFFSKMGCLELFNEIKALSMFRRGSSRIVDGICIDNFNTSYIVIGQFPDNKIEYYTNLVHEMGHAYANKILNEVRFDFYDNEIYREVIALFFVRAFTDYLEKEKAVTNDVIKKIKKNNEIISYYNLTLAKKASDTIKDGGRVNHISYKKYIELIKDSKIDPYIHHYAIGDMIANKLFLEYLSDEKAFILDLPYLIRKISNLDFDEILEKYCRDEKREFCLRKK